MKNIFISFPITNEEYTELDDLFGDLCNFANWQLLNRNKRNNHTSDFEDISQELKLSLVRAGCYYKRQVYLENCFNVIKQHAQGFDLEELSELESLWSNRTRHGANRQTFGDKQELILEDIMSRCVPADKHPNKKQPLRIDNKFKTYCKAIAWNTQKNLGKKITKEKNLRNAQVSLSEFDYLASM